MQGRKDFFKGTSRKSRLRKALSIDYAKIDERSLPDLLKYAVSLSEKIPFFDPNGDVKINWSEFFSRNDLVQLIYVSSFQIEKFEQEINDQINKLYAFPDTETQVQTLNNLSYVILLIAQAINNLKKNLSINEFTLDLIYAIGNSINTELKDLITELNTYQQVLRWQQPVLDINSEINVSWGINSTVTQVETIDEATIDRFKEVFNTFFNVIKHLKERSEEVLSKFLNGLQNTEPHIALFLAFLRLFKYLQDFQNKLTERHLEFYYKEVLQTKSRPPVPDSVNVSFQLKPGVASVHLPKDTRLLAGKDKEGNKIIYTTNRDVDLSSTHISEIATIFLSRDREYGRSINQQLNYTGIYSRSSPPLSGKYAWPAFGEDQYDKPLEKRTLDWARLGFIISSATLIMADGERNIEIIIYCTATSFLKFWKSLIEAGRHEPEGVYRNSYKIVSTAFLIGISSAEGIASIDCYSCTLNKAQSAIKLAFTLATDHPPVAPLASDKSPENFPSINLPFVQVLLNESSSLYLYSLLQRLEIEDIVLKISVNQSKNLKLYNNYGELTLSSPAQLFGAIPENDSYLLVGHAEAFQKDLVTFGLKLGWYQLPVQPLGMKKYFEAYGQPVNTTDYQLHSSLLKNSKWLPVENQPAANLFEEVPAGDQEIKGIIEKETAINLNLKILKFEKEIINDQYEYTSKTKGGFFKLTLKCPGLGFGHSSYAQTLSDTVLTNSRLKKGETPKKMPNLPFSPLLNHAECSYTAQAIASKSKNEIQLFHLAPFGFEQADLRSRQHPVKLLTQLEGRGILHIGFDQYPAGGELSLLFQMQETFYEEVKGDIPKVSWHFLSDNKWIPLKDDDIIQDTTQGFLHDGIVRIKIPKEISKDNTLMNANLLWLKGQIERGSVIRGHISCVYENAVDATWNGESSDEHLESSLKAHTIVKLETPVPEIAEIKQPENSFFGRIAEPQHKWILRISERLRHKNRAITAKDFEELVLDKFDIIFKVQCFMAYNSVQNHKTVVSQHLPPGKAHVVVVPDIDNESVKDKLYPRLKGFRLMEIRDYLKSKASPFVNIEVTNPYYEPLRVHANVKFDGKRPDGYYLDQLNTDISQFLSAWLYSEIKEEEFGTSIYKSDVLGFVQNRPYVEFVTEFSLVRINRLNGLNDMFDSAKENNNGEEEIKPKFPWSIITSARQHDLKVINEVSYRPPSARSIGNMKIESDFLLD